MVWRPPCCLIYPNLLSRRARQDKQASHPLGRFLPDFHIFCIFYSIYSPFQQSPNPGSSETAVSCTIIHTTHSRIAPFWACLTGNSSVRVPMLTLKSCDRYCCSQGGRFFSENKGFFYQNKEPGNLARSSLDTKKSQKWKKHWQKMASTKKWKILTPTAPDTELILPLRLQ